MEQEQLKQTKFDSMVTNRNMQLAKAVIPYIDQRLGTYLGMYIKIRELQNAVRIMRPPHVSAMNTDKHPDMENMLNDLKDFLSDEERENIDMMMSMMEMMNMDDDMKQSMMSDYMGMFGM